MIIFIHIEKTAGTTLNYLFINNFIFFYSLKTWDIWSNNPNYTVSEQHYKRFIRIFPFIKGIGGHHLRYLDNQVEESEMKFITFVREPIDRYLSHWRHQRYKMNIDWTIEQFLDEPRFNNNMVRKFSKSTSVEEAINVINKMDFVGVQEDFDTSLLLMKSELSLGDDFSLDYKYRNKGVSNNNTEPLTKGILERIKKNNEKDIMLYNYIIENIHKRNKDRYKGDLNSELKELKRKRINYKENQFKKIIQKLTKNIFIRPMDYLINNISLFKE
jgi:hypothetical protein